MSRRRLARLAKTAGPMKNKGGELEEALLEMHENLDNRLNDILELISVEDAT
jgi:hypothetical protein